MDIQDVVFAYFWGISGLNVEAFFVVVIINNGHMNDQLIQAVVAGKVKESFITIGAENLNSFRLEFALTLITRHYLPKMFDDLFELIVMHVDGLSTTLYNCAHDAFVTKVCKG